MTDPTMGLLRAMVTDPIVVVALLTPFDREGRLDRAALSAHVRFLIEEGVDALMPCGTTGEGPLLEEDEAVEVFTATREAAGGEARVIAHAGRASTPATVRLARRAVAAGADAVSAVVPFYYRLGQGQVLQHYRSLLDAVPDAPVYAYTIPHRTGNEMDPDTLAMLADRGLAGLKDSTKSFERHLEYLTVAKDRGDLEVLMGTDGMVLDALRAGAAGSVSAGANLYPGLLVRLKRAFLEGSAEAEAIQAELAEARAALDRGPALSELKRAVARLMAERGHAYPDALRSPLG